LRSFFATAGRFFSPGKISFEQTAGSVQCLLRGAHARPDVYKNHVQVDGRQGHVRAGELGYFWATDVVDLC